VSRGQPLNIQPAECGNGLLHAFRSASQQVQPAQNRVNRPAASEMPDVSERVHHARVGAAQEYHKALRGIEEQGLIIQERIGPGTGGVEEETAAGIFEGVLTGNLSGDEDALQHFRGLGSSDYACGRLADGLSACRI